MFVVFALDRRTGRASIPEVNVPSFTLVERLLADHTNMTDVEVAKFHDTVMHDGIAEKTHKDDEPGRYDVTVLYEFKPDNW